MIVRVSIANIDAKGLALRLQAAGLDGTAWDHVGTARWGVEAGATFETVVVGTDIDRSEPLREFIAHTLQELREEAAYLTVDGRLAFLLYAGVWSDGKDKGRIYDPIAVKVEAL